MLRCRFDPWSKSTRALSSVGGSGKSWRETDVAESQPPETKSGAGIYILGVLLLGGGIAAIVIFSGDDKPAPAAPTVAKTEEPVGVVAAPPPPPPPATASETASAVVEEDAGPPAGSGKVLAGGGGTGACSKCGEGTSNGSLNSALQGAAGSARGCYNRVVQKNQGAAGKMNVSVQVGASGQVCSAAITNDSVGNGEVSSCVLSRFQGKSFPKPDKGCVTINIPLSFTVKE
jgi:hypothetical protein